ncbi:hypothetical protein [Nocardia sp. SSK8]|uniref:hypothetical protein n=1 Tax=Nocardia sp. SSK8 TaxID=3120154 RepID=UPI0030081F80
MTSDRQSDRHGQHQDGFAEFTEELRLLAEVLLARVEPVLRRTAADGQADLGGCAWCPVCAAAALVRGDHHDVVAALADHGTAMVTVLREALAGVPVDPLLPPEWLDHAAGHPNPGQSGAATDTQAAHDTRASGDHDPGSTPRAEPAGRSRVRWDGARKDATATPRPRRVDEFPAPRGRNATPRTPGVPPIPPESGPIPTTAAHTDESATTTPRGTGERHRSARTPRAPYVDIPVTIRG